MPTQRMLVKKELIFVNFPETPFIKFLLICVCSLTTTQKEIIFIILINSILRLAYSHIVFDLFPSS